MARGRKAGGRDFKKGKAGPKKASKRRTTRGQVHTAKAREETMKVRPLHDRILVKRVEEGEERRGGIIIPDTAKEKPQRGKVIAVGDGKVLEDGTRVPLDVKAGDHVLFGKYAGSEVKVDDQEYLILLEDDILGVLE